MDLGGGFLYRLTKDAYGYIRRNHRSLTDAERIDLRAKWAPVFDEKIRERHVKKLRKDVIIRDIRRADEYPNLKEGKGISPWFKAGLVGTYQHRGIQVLIDWVSLIQVNEDIWRFPGKDENETVTAGLVGYIRFENIQHVNWDGDEYYGNSHIYCHFDEKGRQPYEYLMYCEKRDLDGWPYFSELAPMEQVHKASKKAKTKRYYPID